MNLYWKSSSAVILSWEESIRKIPASLVTGMGLWTGTPGFDGNTGRLGMKLEQGMSCGIV